MRRLYTFINNINYIRFLTNKTYKAEGTMRSTKALQNFEYRKYLTDLDLKAIGFHFQKEEMKCFINTNY